MSQKKKEVRNRFNTESLERSGYRCVGCGLQATKENWKELLDVHHVQNRETMPAGGYVKENGAPLCKVGKNCHLLAEQFHITGTAVEGYSPEDLYRKIGSSYEKATEASRKLERAQAK